jgi:hypothetical protein
MKWRLNLSQKDLFCNPWQCLRPFSVNSSGCRFVESFYSSASFGRSSGTWHPRFCDGSQDWSPSRHDQP